MTQFGPDVSSNNGSVDWAKVKSSGASFAWTKLTEGTAYINPTAGPNWHGIQAMGLVRGAYHFARPDQGNSPEAEAKHFLAVLGGDVQVGDLLALDIEVGSGDLSSWCLSWLQTVEKSVGFKPLVYSGAWFYSGKLNAALSAYPLWLSAYPNVTRPYLEQNPTYFPEKVTAPWNKCALWQFSEKSGYQGISGSCDDNIFWGTLDELKALGKPKPTEAAKPKPKVAPPGNAHDAVLVMDAHVAYLLKTPSVAGTNDLLAALRSWPTFVK